MLAALDGFKQERFARAADLAVGGERCFQIGQDAARDGNEVSLRAYFKNSSKVGEYITK